MNNDKGCEQLQNGYAQYKALWGLEASRSIEDFKVGYFDESDLTEKNISELCDVANGAMLVIGFASPDFDMKSMGAVLKSYMPYNVKFFMVSTAGELCSGFAGEPLYKPNVEGRKKIVLQSFSRRMLQDCQLITLKLPNDDFLNDQIVMTADERVEKLRKEFCDVKLNFLIKAEDTVALTFIDGLAKCEANVMQALYDSKRYPCVVIGGSTGGPMDLSSTYIYDGQSVLENYVLICLIKLKAAYKFGIFKSQGFERENIEFKIADANHAMRYVTKVVDENMQFVDFVVYLKRTFNCATLEELEVVLKQYSFAIEINGEIFARAVQRIDKESGRVYFYCDISIGEKLIIVKRSSFVESLKRDWQRFMENKPQPIAGLLIDCVTRRVVNEASLDKVNLFAHLKVGGFSSFGELLGVPINETLTAIFFFRVYEDGDFQDKYHDCFPVFYGEFVNYFLLRRLKQIQIVGELENKLIEKFKESNGIYREVNQNDAADKSFAKIFHEDLLVMNFNNDTIAGKSVFRSMDRIIPTGGAINDVGLLVNYMQMMLDNLSNQKENLEKTVLDMKKSIYRYAKDELTDTYTRRAGYELISNLMKTKIRGTDKLIFAFIDLNNLKIANDEGGHDEGDYYLRTTILLLKEKLGDVDLICRYGGDEFILVFPNGDLSAVNAILNDTNKQLAEITEGEQKPYAMSFAYGVFVYEYGTSLSFEEILKMLDDEMYQVKLEQKKVYQEKYMGKYS